MALLKSVAGQFLLDNCSPDNCLSENYPLGNSHLGQPLLPQTTHTLGYLAPGELPPMFLDFRYIVQNCIWEYFFYRNWPISNFSESVKTIEIREILINLYVFPNSIPWFCMLDSQQTRIAAQSFIKLKILAKSLFFLIQVILKAICMIGGNSCGRFSWKSIVTEFGFYFLKFLGCIFFKISLSATTCAKNMQGREWLLFAYR